MLDFGYYNMDCMEGMKQFPDKFFDLCVADPPYGINVGHNIGRRKKDGPTKYSKVTWDSEPPSKEYFKEIFRVSKNVILWGANHYISQIPYDSPCWLVWDKMITDEVSFANVELAWTSFRTTSKRFSKCNLGGGRIHPTQKPIELYLWIATHYTKKGDKILDTHVGSASSLIAYHRYGLEYVGFEIDEGYYRKSLERLEDEKAQINMFEEVRR